MSQKVWTDRFRTAIWPEDLPEQTHFQDCLHDGHSQQRNHLILALHGSPKSSDQAKARKMAQCGQGVVIYADPDTHKVQPHQFRCRDRLCPYCAKIRSARAAAQIRKAMSYMKAPKHLVLTVKSIEGDLTGQLQQLVAWFKELRKDQLWKRLVSGGLYCLEATFNPDTGRWHPHVHAIIDGAYIPIKAINYRWEQITKDSKFNWIKAVTDHDAAAVELSKYIGKPQHVADLHQTTIQEYSHAVHGVRMMQTFGKTHGIRLSDEDPADPLGPNAFSISLNRLAFLFRNGVHEAGRMMMLIAARYPLFGNYVYTEFPMIKPEGIPPPTSARLRDILDNGTVQQARHAYTHEDQELIDAQLFLDFKRIHDLEECAALPPQPIAEA